MSITSSQPVRRYAILIIALVGALFVSASAGATVQTFHRFEAVVDANYIVNKTCPDNSTVQLRVTVIGGHEEEAEDGVTTLDSDFLTVLIRGFDCGGIFVNDLGFGPAEFTFSPSLQEANVTGTITTRDSRSVTVDMSWEGTGPIEVTDNVTIRDGFTGHFHGEARDAVATGTVVVNDETLVDGATTTNAEIETLEDTNITHDGGN